MAQARNNNESIRITNTLWFTRNITDGVLQPRVQVWLRRPARHMRPSGDVYWFAERSPGAGQSAIYAAWNLDACAKEIGTFPEDARQCIVREGREGLFVYLPGL